jgi:uncharacterized protein YndB with AHSA1/START domain
MEKQKIQLEYAMGGIPVGLLWSYVSTASGLKEWFADDVYVNGKVFTFAWSGQTQDAVLLSTRSGQSIRFKWSDGEPKTYFEMRLSYSDLTEITTLTIVDFVDADELEDSRELWDTQVNMLRRKLGCRVE